MSEYHEPMQLTHSSLASAFSEVASCWLSNPKRHVHACLGLTCEDVVSDHPVIHYVYIEHCDHQRQLLATLKPATRKTIVGGKLVVDWTIKLADLNNPLWLTYAFKSRGCGPRRYTMEQAEQEFIDHAAKYHPSGVPTFHPTSPGRVVVRLETLGQPGFRPYGVILDERVVRGERVFTNEPTETVGIDIYG